MRFLCLLFLAFTLQQTIAGQSKSFHIDQISPYAKAVPGQIIEARVEGLADSPTMMIDPKDLMIGITQDGNTFEVRPRTARNMFVSKSPEPGPPDFSKMKPLWSIGFVVPKGLHPGEAEVVAIYEGKRSDVAKITIESRPAAPVVGSTSVERVSIGPIASGSSNADMGLRLERGAKAELHVLPLVDPDDPQASVMVSFHQGEVFDAVTQVRHENAAARQMGSGVQFLRDRDYLELVVPAALSAGPAKMAVRIRANGETGESVIMPVLITDASRVAELPAENAPRALVVNPQKIGAGQALMISVDHVRTLKPDPKQAMVMFEQGGVRYLVKPEMNSAVFNPTKDDDSPLLLIARPTRQIIGKAQVRVFSASRGEQGGLSTPTPVEILEEVTPPELTQVAEATDAELMPLRQMYEMQKSAGREFPEFNPGSRYLALRVKGLDMNPQFIRVSLEQDGVHKTLQFGDFSSLSGDLFIVRLPKGFHKGTVTLSVQNEGAEKLSEPAMAKFELSH